MVQQATFELSTVGEQTVERGVQHVMAADDPEARGDARIRFENDRGHTLGA